ncbi:MAG: AAA family ATPase [Nanoarchaeota archaeon]|nr:AAA family ATPase [Nanoarchaeota archaeon]
MDNANPNLAFFDNIVLEKISEFYKELNNGEKRPKNLWRSNKGNLWLVVLEDKTVSPAVRKALEELKIPYLESENAFFFEADINKLSEKEEKEVLEKLIYIPGKMTPEQIEEVLSPLNSAFFTPMVLNEVLLKTSIADLIRGKEPKYPGAILYGKGGTGKSHLIKTISKIFEKMGCYVREIHLSAEVSDQYVGSRGKALEAIIQACLVESKERNLPSFVYLDEASTLMADDEGGSSDKYYKEGRDVLKKYIGNYRELIFAISTNDEKADFEAPIVREGRLSPIEIEYPNETQLKKMWAHYIKKNMDIEFSEEEYWDLAKFTPREQGAFVEEFTRTYYSTVQTFTLTKLNKTVQESLIQGTYLEEEVIKKDLTFEKFKNTLKERLELKNATSLVNFSFDTESTQEGELVEEGKI